MSRLTIVLLTYLLLATCQLGDAEKLVTIDNKYSISIPSFLVKGSNLNEDASLQYLNAWREFYVIVIDESKFELKKSLVDNDLMDVYSNDLKGYTDLLIDGLELYVSVSIKSDITDTIINNLPARLLTISGRVDGIDAYYSLAFIEGRERYYQIFVWTLSYKEDEYKEKMSKIMYSFKEL